MENDTFHDILARLQSDIADADAWPRPSVCVRSCFVYVASAERPVTTDDIIASFPTMTKSQASVALEQLAGLLAIYGAPVRLHRKQCPDVKIRVFVYYLVSA